MPKTFTFGEFLGARSVIGTTLAELGHEHPNLWVLTPDIGATVIERSGPDWIIGTLAEGDTLCLPETGIEVPLDELYEGIDFGAARHQEPTTEAP